MREPHQTAVDSPPVATAIDGSRGTGVHTTHPPWHDARAAQRDERVYWEPHSL